MRVLIFSFLFLIVLLFSLSGLGINATSASQANATIAKVREYVNTLNASGYLVFSPNLTAAYAYLHMAEKAENTSPEAAIAYAQLAYDSATKAYAKLNQYRLWSAIIMLLLTIAFAVLLYFVMAKPRSKAKQGKRQK